MSVDLTALRKLCAHYPWMWQAVMDYGKREIKGSSTADFIKKCLAACKLITIHDDETPWCATWVGGKLEMAGYQSTRSAWARSYLGWKFGMEIHKPQFGCVVVLERGPSSGHVAFFVGLDAAGNYLLLGGNQNDQVNVKAFPKSRVIKMVWPQGAKVLPIPVPKVASAAAVSTNEA